MSSDRDWQGAGDVSHASGDGGSRYGERLRSGHLETNVTDYSGARNYRQGRRRAFMCAKRTSLDRLGAPTEPVGTLAHLKDYAWLGGDMIPRLPARLRRKAVRKRS